MSYGNVIVGTAGHIDHGKTSLIKKLTGIDTDRFEEEKRRGITIDLGFAFFDLPSGKRAGIIDVPGHERFIKNMLAGAGGMDVVLLVIAADEGIMPQTQEHLDILTLLEVKKGIVVLNKADLVDDDWLEMMTQEVREHIKDTFLKDAPMVAVSSVTGMGIETLIETIDSLVETVEPKKVREAVRLPIDRVFIMQGFGTVITGTLLEGSLNEGDVLEVYPKGLEARVRQIQVHGAVVKEASAGQRVAVNIANLKKTDLDRGDVLALKGSLAPTHIIDAQMKLLPSYHREIGNWTRLRLYQGTKEALCRLVLLDREVMKPGETAFVQLRLEEPMAFKYGDHFVLRFYSPLETLGGGMILDPNALKHKRFKTDLLDRMAMMSSGKPEDIVLESLQRQSENFPTIEDLVKQTGLPQHEVEAVLSLWEERGAVLKFGQQYCHEFYLEQKSEEMIRLINDYHQKNPLKLGIGKEEVKSRLFKECKGKIFDEILNLYSKKDMIKLTESLMSLPFFTVSLTAEQKKKTEALIGYYETAGYLPAQLGEVLELLKISQKDKALLEFLQSNGILVRVADGVLMHQKHLEEAKASLMKHFETHEDIALGEFRDLLNTSRKGAVTLLDYFDQQKITQRVGDSRRLK